MWSTGINRNIVECKGALGWIRVAATPVLIETLWNVKTVTPQADMESVTSINRNIVECKVFLRWYLARSSRCINRNIVECKEIHAYLKLQTSYVLIETLWNVKRANISDIMA